MRKILTANRRSSPTATPTGKTRSNPCRSFACVRVLLCCVVLYVFITPFGDPTRPVFQDVVFHFFVCLCCRQQGKSDDENDEDHIIDPNDVVVESDTEGAEDETTDQLDESTDEEEDWPEDDSDYHP